MGGAVYPSDSTFFLGYGKTSFLACLYFFAALFTHYTTPFPVAHFIPVATGS